MYDQDIFGHTLQSKNICFIGFVNKIKANYGKMNHV